MKKYQLLFFVGALWNFAVGLTALLQPEAVIERFYGAEAVTDDLVAGLASSDFAACVILFGLGYLIVSRDVTKNHGTVLLGIIGKLGVVGSFSFRYFNGQATPMVFFPVTIDGIFAILFALFLVKQRSWY